MIMSLVKQKLWGSYGTQVILLSFSTVFNLKNNAQNHFLMHKLII